MVLMEKRLSLLLVVAFASFIVTTDAACVERERKEGNVTETTMEKLSQYIAEASCQLRPVVDKVKEGVKSGYEFLKFKVDEIRNKTESKHTKTDKPSGNQPSGSHEQGQIVFSDNDDASNKRHKTNESSVKTDSRITISDSTESIIFRDSDEDRNDVPTKRPISIQPNSESNEPNHRPATTTESIVKTDTKSTIEPRITTESIESIIFRDGDDAPINLSTSLPPQTKPTTTTNASNELASTKIDLSLDDRIALSAPEMCPKGEIKIDGKCRQEIQL